MKPNGIKLIIITCYKTTKPGYLLNRQNLNFVYRLMGIENTETVMADLDIICSMFLQTPTNKD
jgi:hypothetical protein